MSGLKIKVGLDLQATPDSLQKLQQQTQKAAQVSVGTMAQGAGQVGGVSGQGASVLGNISGVASKAVSAFKAASVGLAAVGGAAAATGYAVLKAEQAYLALKEAITGAGFATGKAITAEQGRLSVAQKQLDILRVQASYVNQVRDNQIALNKTLGEATLITDAIDRGMTTSIAKIQAEFTALADSMQQIQAKRQQIIDKASADESRQAANAFGEIGSRGMFGDWLDAVNGKQMNSSNFMIGDQFGTITARTGMGGRKTGEFELQLGAETKIARTQAQAEAIMANWQAAARQERELVAERKKMKEDEEKALAQQIANEKELKEKRLAAVAKLEVDSSLRQAGIVRNRNAAIDNITGADAGQYAIQRTRINEEASVRSRFEFERFKVQESAARTGGTIDPQQMEKLQAQEESALRAIEAKERSLIAINNVYNEVANNYMQRNTAGLAAGQEWERNMQSVLKIESQYRQEVEKATSAEELSVAEMRRKTALTAEQLKNQINLRTVQAEDAMRQAQQGAQRNRSELGISSGADVAADSAKTISDFRIKIFEGMRSGTMSAMDFQIAGIEKSYALQMSKEKALHQQKMQDLQAYESQREQQINLEYEQSTQADRQRIAVLSKMLQDPNLSASQRAGIESQMQQVQGNINSAESTRREALDEVRTNARGSVRTDAAFRENMAKAEARHREQISYLKTIATNTGKVVTDVAASYKETSAAFFGQSNLGTFGMSASPFSRNPQMPQGFADQRLIVILEMIARNTAPMRNYTNSAYYA